MTRNWYKFFWLAVPMPTEATKNSFQPHCICLKMSPL